MTAEIAILNKHAVAMAADSAVTLGAGRKIYNSADKLFALSKHCPVAIMVYGSASFASVPWEVLIKHYRQSVLKEKSFKSLDGHAKHFISFLRSTNIISEEAETEFVDRVFYTELSHVLKKIQSEVKDLYTSKGVKINRVQTISIVKAALALEKNHLESMPFLDKGSANAVNGLARKDVIKTKKVIAEIFQKLPLDSTDITLLRRICALAIYKGRFTTSKSGIVISGYGDSDIYPSTENFELEGRVGSYLKLRKIANKSVSITNKNRASILAFAQSEMVTTFMDGIHPDYLDVLSTLQGDFFSNLARILSGLLKGKVPNKSITELSSQLNSLWPDIKQQLAQFSRKEFVEPVLNTVAALPKDELSSMCEALVSLTLFRR